GVRGFRRGALRISAEAHLPLELAVGAEGKVQGDIVARSVRIGGRVVGNVQGHEKVEILPTGRLEGDVAAPRVVLAEGAFFKGKVEMTGKPGATPAPTPSGGGRAPGAAARADADGRRQRAGRRSVHGEEGSRRVKVGVPKEIKNHEYRVGLIPAVV